MNYRIMGKTMGGILNVEAVAMLPSIIAALVYHESLRPFILSIIILLAVGIPFYFMLGEAGHFSSRCACATTVLSWLVMSLFGALPYCFCGYFDTVLNCFFESMSGFSTTGATILSDIEALPRSILLWRCITQYLGGMGVIVLVTAIMPSSGSRSHFLTRAEIPGVLKRKLTPKLATTSKLLYAICTVLTIALFITLLIIGIKPFNALTIAISTAGTGGFAITNDSIAAYNSVSLEIVLIVFMLAYAVNFSVFFMIVTGNLKQALKSDELRFFTFYVIAAVSVVTFVLWSDQGNLSQSLRSAVFTVCSMVTTTGFVSTDYTTWPMVCKVIIILLMITGACGGSTSCGIKCSRVSIMLKSIVHEIRQTIHPNVVSIVRINNTAADKDTVIRVLRFFAAYLTISFIGIFLISFDNFDISTNLTAVISCMSNIGPAMGLIGHAGNYSMFSDFSKLVLTALMLIGRLEIFPVLVFLSPSTWSKQ